MRTVLISIFALVAAADADPPADPDPTPAPTPPPAPDPTPAPTPVAPAAAEFEAEGSSGYARVKGSSGATTVTYGKLLDSQDKGCTNWASIELTHGYDDADNGNGGVTEPADCANECAAIAECTSFELRNVNGADWKCMMWKGEVDAEGKATTPPCLLDANAGAGKQITGQWFEEHREQGLDFLPIFLAILLLALLLALLHYFCRGGSKPANRIAKRGVTKPAVTETARSEVSNEQAASVVPLLPVSPMPVSPVVTPMPMAGYAMTPGGYGVTPGGYAMTPGGGMQMGGGMAGGMAGGMPMGGGMQMGGGYGFRGF